MDRSRRVGIDNAGQNIVPDTRNLQRHIFLKLAAIGKPIPDGAADPELLDIGRDLFARYREQNRLLSDHLNPVDARIQAFLDRLLSPIGLAEPVRIPTESFILDRWGLARELALPIGRDRFENEMIASFRTPKGVIHNPANDRRTTKGVFHVAEAGLPVPDDKIGVPLNVYASLLRAALNPPRPLMRLPFSSEWESPIEVMVSLMLRPLVCPAIPDVSAEKRMEIRFFAPGGLVSNLDFVESIFGNAGDPFLPENDAALDVDHFTGHSGFVILAPHLPQLKKKDLGLPHMNDATAKQRENGMAWSDPNELYNGGRPFKITARDKSGVMVTILADNYFGYCKKEVKTQISFAANLFGAAEEEHAGGALAFSSYSLGEKFVAERRDANAGYRYDAALELLGDAVTTHEDGYATDRAFPTIHYLPENVEIDRVLQEIRWTRHGEGKKIRLLPDHVYLLPSGYKVRMEKHPAAPSWRLVGTVAEGAFIHKPCTVSGGGKSEISKSMMDAVIYGPIYVSDFERDIAQIESIFEWNYANRWLPGHDPRKYSQNGASRPLLSPERSLGSVIKLLTPNEQEFTPEYNTWLNTIPNHIRAIVFIMKRFYNVEWGTNWREQFSVDLINGTSGHELKFEGRKLVGSYLRIGLSKDSAWRTFKLRQDFMPADKVQMEDDITASVVVSASKLFGLPSGYDHNPSLKLAENCEWRLFQRPDDAIDPGYDKQTEADMSSDGIFASNFQPLRKKDVQEIVDNVTTFDAFSDPMKKHLQATVQHGIEFTVCSAYPRIVDGKPSKNPRYLQTRPDVSKPRDRYLAEVGTRLARRIPRDKAVVFPVTSVLSGRRNNPPDGPILPLCVFNPIHYQELPELFMDYVCSVTGKSPSTTGAGSEGALTKGPFNAISATADLNNALVSMLLCRYAGFSTAAGWIGPNYRFDHDISLLVPELWCRLSPDERDPVQMIARGHLEKVVDFEFQGRNIPASRLGYRITSQFIGSYFGRIFDSPRAVFTEEILRPEKQDLSVFAAGVDNLVNAQTRSAEAYFADGSIENACPPLAALLHIMAHGHFQGKDAQHSEIRAMFTREALLRSAWYKERLGIKQQRDVSLWKRHVRSLTDFLSKSSHRDEAVRLGIENRLRHAQAQLSRVLSPMYISELQGSIGADPISIEQVADGASLPDEEARPSLKLAGAR